MSQIGNSWKTTSNLLPMGTEYNKHHLSECMKIVIPLKGGMFEIFYDLRCFAMFRKFLLSTHFTNRANYTKMDGKKKRYHKGNA